MALLSVDDALARILKGAAPLPGEPVALEAALHRALAGSLKARLTQPPFSASAMDGYAVRADDIIQRPARLRVIGEAAAGHPFGGTLGAGEALRISTGAPVPQGADAIVIQEITQAGGDHVIVGEGAIDAGHIRPRGFDFSQGEALIEAGTRLGPRQIALAAAMGHGTLEVRKKPRVAILSTGDELVAPGDLPGPGQIIASNHLGIAALVRLAGGEPQMLGIARDTQASLEAHLGKATEADILVTIGGASVGKHDLVGPVLQARGMALSFWKIAMRPGKPLMFGTLGAQRILGLPGNPVSALICARVFLVPLIGALLGALPGQTAQGEQLTRAKLDAALKANGPRQHYLRATLRTSGDGQPIVTPVRSQDSSLLAPLAAADCLIVRPPNDPDLPLGAFVQVLPMDF